MFKLACKNRMEGVSGVRRMGPRTVGSVGMSSRPSEEGARSQNPGARRVFRVFRRSFSKTNPLQRPDFANATDFQADRMKAFELQVQHCLAMLPS